MKILLALFSCIVLSVNVMATQPGDEELEADNSFCKYEKYKGRMPGACPRVNEIIYGVTVYENIDLQNKIKLHLFDILSSHKSKSKHNHVILTLGKQWVFSRSHVFKQSYAFHPLTEKQLAVDFAIRIIPIDDKYFVSVTAFLRSSKFLKSAQEVGGIVPKDDVEKYIENLIDTYLMYDFFPKIFPDSNR